MRMLFATYIVIAFQFHGSLTFDLGAWFTNVLSDPVNKIKNWASGLEQWSSSDWECGADRVWLTKLASKAMAQKRCPNVLDQLNSACRWHDFCYSQGLEGQAVCDSRFCDALHNIKFPTEEERKACHLPKAMCDTVKLGGALIYRDKTKQ
ncbi:hypothetical protein Aduo_004779 [Ancylostoma duodenale]